MPHLQLEYSSNIQVSPDLADLFLKLHHMLHETGGIKLENCKSRVRIADSFLIASGDDKLGFVHLDIRFVEGRTAERKQAIGNAARNILIDWFSESLKRLELQITVEIRDIELSDYFKYPEGTITQQ